jgi:hypothetical protein
VTLLDRRAGRGERRTQTRCASCAACTGSPRHIAGDAISTSKPTSTKRSSSPADRSSRDQVAVTAAIAAGAHGDLEAAAAWLRPVAQSDPRWREAFERTVRLGHMPQALLDRLD